MSMLIIVIVLSFSCTTNVDEKFNDDLKTLNHSNFEDFAKIQFQLSSELWDLLKLEENINTDLLIKSLEYNDNVNIESILSKSGIKNHELVASLLTEINENVISLANSNYHYSNFSNEELEDLFLIEISKINRYEIENLTKINDDCEDSYDTAVTRCETAWSIALGF